MNLLSSASGASAATPTTPAQPTVPPAANPPMFGSQASKAGNKMTNTSTWVGSVLGATANPSNVASKSLLGA